MPAPESSVYCATKFGLRGFGYSLNVELQGKGVGVTTVFPASSGRRACSPKSGVKLPPGVGTSSPQEVADAVVTGIEKGKARSTSRRSVRSSARLFGAAPSLVVAIGRRVGGARLAAEVAEGQRDHRS